MTIGGGGLNGGQDNSGSGLTNTSQIATNPSLAGSKAPTSGTPGVGGVPTGAANGDNSGSGNQTPVGSGSFSSTPPSGGGGFNGGLDTNGFSVNGTQTANQSPFYAGGGGPGAIDPRTTLGMAPGTPAPMTAASMIAGKTLPGAAPTTPTPTPTTPAANAGAAIYGLNGNQTLSDWQTEQANTFNSNQLQAQGQYTNALSGMPYNTQIGSGNPYDQYVANPATPGHASNAFNSDANVAAWNASGLNSQLANPTGTFQSQGTNSAYGNNQLAFLANTLQRYGGVNGQNRFGNGFSPLLTGQPGQTQGGLSQAVNNGGTTGGLSLQELLPLLMGLGQQGPAAGSYGNLGGNPGNPVDMTNYHLPQSKLLPGY